MKKTYISPALSAVELTNAELLCMSMPGGTNTNVTTNEEDGGFSRRRKSIWVEDE